MLYTRCLKCDDNVTVPEPSEPWEHGEGIPNDDCVIPCPTCGEPLAILGTALGVTEHRRDRVFESLYVTCDDLKGRGEASHDDCLDACRDLSAHLVAVAAFERGDTREQYEHRIACAKEMLEASIRVHSLALRRVMAEPDA